VKVEDGKAAEANFSYDGTEKAAYDYTVIHIAMDHHQH